MKCYSQLRKYYDNRKISEKKQGIMVQKDQRIVIECVYVKIRMKMTHLGFELSSIICISILNSYSDEFFNMNSF